MKKKILSLLLTALVLCAALGSCGAKGRTEDTYWNGAAGDMDQEAPGSPDGYDKPSEPPTEGGWDGVISDTVKPTASLSEKIIYSANVELETVDFDAAVDSVEDMLDRYGAFLESSTVTGKNYNATVGGYQTYRTAKFVIRVPVGSFNNMKDDLEAVGAVVNTNVYTDNITERYYDTEARVRSYEVEQERLLAMLEKCETVGEMLEIENRLSEVRYQLEALESTLRNWQNQVDYSTINVSLREVEEYKRVVDSHRTYWQQVGDGLLSTLEGMGSFFAELFKGIVVALPVILLIAAAAVIVVWSVRRSRAKRRAGRDKAVDADIEPDEK